MPTDDQTRALHDDRGAMVRALRTHGSDRAVAAAYGLSASTVTRWRRRLNIPVHAKPGRQPNDAARLLRDNPRLLADALRRFGSAAAVARQVGVHRSTVARWADRIDTDDG